MQILNKKGLYWPRNKCSKGQAKLTTVALQLSTVQILLCCFNCSKSQYLHPDAEELPPISGHSHYRVIFFFLPLAPQFSWNHVTVYFKANTEQYWERDFSVMLWNTLSPAKWAQLIAAVTSFSIEGPITHQEGKILSMKWVNHWSR